MNVPGIGCVLRVARFFVGGGQARARVAVRHVPTGRFLAGDGQWTHDPDAAVWVDDDPSTRELVAGLACEPVFELVPAATATAA